MQRSRRDKLRREREFLPTTEQVAGCRTLRARVVGLIVTPNASEAKSLAKAIGKATGQSLHGRGFAGIVPREFALTIMRANAPATLDWLDAGESEDGRRRLLLIIATRDGFRLGATPYP